MVGEIWLKNVEWTNFDLSQMMTCCWVQMKKCSWLFVVGKYRSGQSPIVEMMESTWIKEYAMVLGN